jgi:uncharacterized tellurite resistance protein B-like protein
MRELFATRLRERFPDGFTLRAARRDRKIQYRPASGTLLAIQNRLPELASASMPDVLSLRRQFLPLVEIWEQCANELRDFDKASRQAGGATITSEMYEALPLELRSQDHPELPAWESVFAASVDEAGWCVVPVGRLAEIKKIPLRPRLTKKQCETLLITADAIGFVIEPDSRLTGSTYAWEEHVVVLRGAGGHPSEEELRPYRSTAILLRIGLAVANADDQLNDIELERITDHLQKNFQLGEHLSKRLDALKHLIVVYGANDNNLGRALQKSLSLAQRKLVGEYLVSIAAADGIICLAEQKVLRKVFRSLAVSTDELDDLFAQQEQSQAAAAMRTTAEHEDPAGEPVAVLDLDRVRQIRDETARVQSLLQDALADVQTGDSAKPLSQELPRAGSVSNGDTARSPTDVALEAVSVASCSDTTDIVVSATGIPAQYQPFFQMVTTRENWDTGELESLARQQGVMVNAAIDVINEWSTDSFGDLLLDETQGRVIVHKQLLRENECSR